MFNIGGGEILVIALIALIAVGPEQLPSVMRKVGGFVNQIRTMTTGIRDEFMSTVEEANPNNWVGDGSDEKPIVPRGYAENAIKSSADPSATAAGNAAQQTAAGEEVVGEEPAKATFDNSSPTIPTAKEPAADEPVPKEPNAEEPSAEEPSAEEPSAEDAVTEDEA